MQLSPLFLHFIWSPLCDFTYLDFTYLEIKPVQNLMSVTYTMYDVQTWHNVGSKMERRKTEIVSGAEW
jgi:hypothetical protein